MNYYQKYLKYKYNGSTDYYGLRRGVKIIS